jgi:hypothetical protein
MRARSWRTWPDDRIGGAPDGIEQGIGLPRELDQRAGGREDRETQGIALRGAPADSGGVGHRAAGLAQSRENGHEGADGAGFEGEERVFQESAGEAAHEAPEAQRGEAEAPADRVVRIS